MSIQSCQPTSILCRFQAGSHCWDIVMAKIIDHVSQQTFPHAPTPCGIFWRRSPNLLVHRSPGGSPSRTRACFGKCETNELSKISALPESNSVPRYNAGSDKPQRTRNRAKQTDDNQLGPKLGCVPSDCTLPVIGTLPDHFAESVRLARNSQDSYPRASESQIRATWMLHDAAVVANCNTYNRNQPVRELRKGLFFRGRCHGAGIDSTSESFRTAFQTIYDLTGIHAAEDCRMHAIQISDNPRHAPSVQC